MSNSTAVHRLRPVPRQALSDSVFEQLRHQIVQGDLAAGDPLPAERILCEALGVNRGSVREALRRLQQARLVDVRHGGTSRVLDFRQTAGLDLLASLLVTASGEFDAEVVRSVMEMRSALAPDVARLAAERGQAAGSTLLSLAEAMRSAAADPLRLQELTGQFWHVLIDAAGNVAYRLAYNSLLAAYEQCRPLLAQALATELGDTAGYLAIANAVTRGDAKAAATHAGVLVRQGEAGIKQVLSKLGRAERADKGRRRSPSRAHDRGRR